MGSGPELPGGLPASAARCPAPGSVGWARLAGPELQRQECVHEQGCWTVQKAPAGATDSLTAAPMGSAGIFFLTQNLHFKVNCFYGEGGVVKLGIFTSLESLVNASQG